MRVCQGLYLICGFAAACLIAGVVANNLGRVALGVDPKRASSLFAIASTVDSLNPRYRRDRAVALMVTSERSAEVDSGIRGFLLDAIRLEPANPVYRGDLGLFALAQGRYDEAVALLGQAVDRHRFSAYWRTKLLQALNAQAAYEITRGKTSAPETLSAADRAWVELIDMEWAIGPPSKDAILERAKTLVLAGQSEP
jgi:tetratricopeptide (TPR) repeat protein